MSEPDKVTPARRTLGRPRATGPSRSGLSTEQDILAAAARLFCESGYGSASTHAIARAAGVSQAAIYHYFGGKHAILLHLLLETVHPSVELASTIMKRPEPCDIRLWALCSYDVRLLLGGAQNTGSLYLMPEIDNPLFAEFHVERQRLFEVYRALVAGVLGVEESQAHAPASLVFGLVESVILRRRADPGIDADEVAPATADAALRILGLGEERLAAARAAPDFTSSISAGQLES